MLECTRAGGAAGSSARLPNDQQGWHLEQLAELWCVMMLNQTVARVSQGRRKVFCVALCTLFNKEILSSVHLGATCSNVVTLFLGNSIIFMTLMFRIMRARGAISLRSNSKMRLNSSRQILIVLQMMIDSNSSSKLWKKKESISV